METRILSTTTTMMITITIIIIIIMIFFFFFLVAVQHGHSEARGEEALQPQGGCLQLRHSPVGAPAQPAPL